MAQIKPLTRPNSSAELAYINLTTYRGPPGCLAAAGCLDDASVDGDITQLQAHDLVVGLQTDLFESSEHSGSDPGITSAADRGGRAGGVRDPVVGGAQDEDLDQLVEHDPVADARSVTSQRMGIEMLGDQRGELVPQRVDDGRWQSRHETSQRREVASDTSSVTGTRACPA